MFEIRSTRRGSIVLIVLQRRVQHIYKYGLLLRSARSSKVERDDAKPSLRNGAHCSLACDTWVADAKAKPILD